MIKKIKIISNSQYIIIFSDLTKNIYDLEKFKYILNHSIKFIKKLLSNNYTIVIPTYNFNFPKTKLTGTSEKYITSGFLNKYLLKKMKFKRTKRPMYNYAVIGEKVNEIINLKQNSAWGNDSVISFLAQNNAIGIGINIDELNFGWVIIHSCEEKLKVPYRYFKIFKGINLTNKKKITEKMYVRKLNKNLVTDPSKLMKNFNKKKIKNIAVKSHKISIINLNDLYKVGCKMLSKNIFSLTKHV